ncbi:DUF2878 domain-containing protein [Aestuariibacter salexigens]|uniref:DUF2878 domain-containing protein n=1 Tax=Aestuariibacter salexigens TaxID=226010 RepID=UPI000420E39F|nr:DUF2878 domain-containing protein [Aestuariibacter salexigens]
MSSSLLNFALFQTIWFVAAFWQEQALLVLALLVSAIVLVAKQRLTELKVIVCCGVVGIIMDSLLTANQVLVFGSEQQSWHVPVWFMAIWFGFAGTLRHSLRSLTARPVLLTAVAAIFAPLNYLAGARLGALEFGLSTIEAALIISVSWLLVVPTMLIAIFSVHFENGLFLTNNGYEFALALFAATLALTFQGAGRFAIDNVIAKQLSSNSASKDSSAANSFA